jgi:hypothetical protein
MRRRGIEVLAQVHPALMRRMKIQRPLCGTEGTHAPGHEQMVVADSFLAARLADAPPKSVTRRSP